MAEYNKISQRQLFEYHLHDVLPNIRIVHFTLLKSAADYMIHIYYFQTLHLLGSTDTLIITGQIHEQNYFNTSYNAVVTPSPE